MLPPEHVYVTSSSHNWRTLSKLWDKALDEGFFTQASSPPALGYLQAAERAN